MTTQLIILRGISGSGKSTLASHLLQSYNTTIIVSRDDLRIAFYHKDFGPPVDEDFITTAEMSIIDLALTNGISVISDNTNLTPRAVEDKISVARTHGVEIHLREVEVPLSTARSNNRQRQMAGGRGVPEEVITNQYGSFYSHQEDVRELVRAYTRSR